MLTIHSENAVILPQRGSISIEKQTTACLNYCIDSDYGIAAICPYGQWEDAIATIRLGEATLVVVAYGGQFLAEAVTTAGGRVESVHPSPHVVQPVHRFRLGKTADLVRRLFGMGATVAELADLTGEDTGSIRRTLRPRR